MASSPFEVDDQTDEDFFDKLVNEEIDCAGSGRSGVEDDGLNQAKGSSNLSIDEVAPAGVDSDGIGFGVNEMCQEDLGVSASLGANQDTVFSEEGNSLPPGNTNEPRSVVGKEGLCSVPTDKNEGGEMRLGEEAALNKTLHEHSVATDTGVKEVQWSSFGSENGGGGGGGFGSYSDFFSELGDRSEDSPPNMGESGMRSNVVDSVSESPVADSGASNYGRHEESEYGGVVMRQNLGGQDLSGSHYWENLYPGWKYDLRTGQWYQLEGNDTNASTNSDININATPHAMGDEVPLDHGAYYQQQTAQAQSVVGTVAEGCTTGSVSQWSQSSQGHLQYPDHMVFDPQYPGWYYDTIAKEWKLLESYIPASNQLTSIDDNQNYQNQNFENRGSQSLAGQEHAENWDGSVSHYNQQTVNMWQTQHAAKSDASGFAENQELGNHYSYGGHLTASVDQQSGFGQDGSLAQYEQPNWSTDGSNKVVGFQSFIPDENFPQHQNLTKEKLNQHMHFSPACLDSEKPVIFTQQPLQSGNQLSYAPNEGRSSAGRPPHALVTFGFGGKLVVMKDNSSFHANSYGGQDLVGGVINVLNMMEVVGGQNDASSLGWGACNYFHALCQQSFPGPLVGGNVGIREVNKWIEEKIANLETPHMDYRKSEVLRLLFSLLKIACQYYGKLRSPFATDQALKESDCPESAIAKLFASAKRKSEYGTLACCLQNLPSEAQIQATALEVQSLLVSGRKREALQCAREGQFWGIALLLASQLGEQVYGDTVKEMALDHFIAGTPLRTLCLLAAGQPADVFSSARTSSSLHGSAHISKQPTKMVANCLLDEWEENLAIITANRTKNDELVIIHLGDSLWKEHGEITAAHICYLVAEASFETYSDGARLCLIGADHWKFPRTYASPEAIQRTELYEYSKVLGNSQFLLLPFQPYKLMYAHMLAEVGKVADALKYCHAILKSLKTSRAPEVDMWRQLISSLEERIRMHQQGGYGTNLAPTKLVGKLLTFIDSTAHRVVGGLPPPVPSTSYSGFQRNEHTSQPGGLRVSSSQSTMTMSALMPSVSMEPVSELTGENKLPNRSISEPDFGRAPKKVDSSHETISSDTQQKALASQQKGLASGGSSRFSRFGSQLFQKTLGLVLRSQPDRQAKLGEKNRFYYDEKLKRWVEEGAEPPAEEAPLPPPPTTAAFQNAMLDHKVKDAPKTVVFPSDGGQQTESPISSERSPGIPPIPPSSNQFSARGRIGVHSRYVDTFNKGGGTSSNLFQSPSIAAAKPEAGFNPKFFIPTPVASVEETVQTPEESMRATSVSNENHPPSSKEDSFSSLRSSTSSSTSLQRFPSMDNIVQRRTGPMENGNSLVPPPSRRVASWSGSLSDASNPLMMNEIKPLGEKLAASPFLYRPGDPPSTKFPLNRNNSTDCLQEVEL